jgi:thiol:disulfide interchange protein DsbC
MNLDLSAGPEAGTPHHQFRGRKFWALLCVTSLSVGMSVGAVAMTVSRLDALPMGRAASSAVAQALKERLPKTLISSVDCKSISGLCEVVAGTTLFYVDRSARYLMIGRLYDMETRQDLTATRLLELNPDLLAAGAARAAGEQSTNDEPAAAPAQPSASKVSLAELPKRGAIHWGPAAGPKLVVLSDFQCSYCQRLTKELKAIGARVEERPISIFGEKSRAMAEAVLCAANPEQALHAAYEGRALPLARSCDTSGLDANEAFAKRNGFGGTPIIIRPDGAVIEGWRPAAELRAFASGR